jgi:hypothetical protein
LGCDTCPHQKLLAFSCKKRGFCPSCASRQHGAAGGPSRRFLPFSDRPSCLGSTLRSLACFFPPVNLRPPRCANRCPLGAVTHAGRQPFLFGLRSSI